MDIRHSFSGGKAGQRRWSRRTLLVCGILAALSACTQTVLSPEAAENVTIRRIAVSTTELGQFSVRGLPVTPASFSDDLKSAVERKLGNRIGPAGNADVAISVTRVLLKSPEVSLFVGGQSFIDAKVQVTRISDGAIIAGPTAFSGLSDKTRMGGIIGAATAPSAEEDYRTTVEGFATMLNAALFEGGATIY